MKIILIISVLFLTTGCFMLKFPELSQEKGLLERELSHNKGIYEDQVDRYKNQVIDLNILLTDTKAEIESVKARYQRETLSLTERMQFMEDEYETVIANLKREVEVNKNNYAALARAISEKDQTINQLKESLNLAQYEVEVQKQNVDHYQLEINKFESSYEDIYEDFHKTVDDYEKLLRENEQLAQKVYSLEQQIRQKEQESRELQARLDEQREGDAAPPVFALNETTESLKRSISTISSDIEVSQTPYSIRILIPGNKLFTVGTAQIDTAGHSTLNQMASILQNHENSYYFFVEGHTDALPLVNAPFPSNWELSATRATNLVRYFIRETQLNPESFVALACSSYRPISEVLEKNRRIEIVLLPKEIYVF